MNELFEQGFKPNTHIEPFLFGIEQLSADQSGTQALNPVSNGDQLPMTFVTSGFDNQFSAG